MRVDKATWRHLRAYFISVNRDEIVCDERTTTWPARSAGLPGSVLNRNLGRGVRPTQWNPDLVQDTKDVNFATLSKRKCRNFFLFKTKQTVPKFAFSRISTKAHEISENYVVKGGEKDKIFGDGPVKAHKCEIVYPV